MIISVSHYKKSDKELFCNGGRLYICDKSIVLKNLFKTVAIFNSERIKFKALPNEFWLKAVELSEGEKRYILLLTKLNYLKLTQFLSITNA